MFTLETAPHLLLMHPFLKDKSKVRGDFWHDFHLKKKLAENDDVGETVIWGL